MTAPPPEFGDWKEFAMRLLTKKAEREEVLAKIRAACRSCRRNPCDCPANKIIKHLEDAS